MNEESVWTYTYLFQGLSDVALAILIFEAYRPERKGDRKVTDDSGFLCTAFIRPHL